MTILKRNIDAAKAVIEEIEAASGQATCVEVDVSSESLPVQSAFDFLDRVEDVLINNAGIASVGNVEATTGKEMDRVYAVNVKGVFHCTKSAIPKLKASGKGVILNMASIASYLGISDRFAWFMTKGAVYAMTLSVAKDYIEYGIRCNCICLARVHTSFIDSYLEKHYAERKEEMFKEQNPISRLGLRASPRRLRD